MAPYYDMAPTWHRTTPEEENCESKKIFLIINSSITTRTATPHATSEKIISSFSGPHRS